MKPQTDHLTGVDLNPTALKEADRRGIYDELHLGDIRDWPLGEADAVTLFDSIEHISKEEGYELLERCKGRLTMLTTPWWSLSLLSPWGAWDGHKCAWSAEELRREGFNTEGYSFLPDIPMSLGYGGITVAMREC